jgi:pilus assembly protein Flp/PilA
LGIIINYLRSERGASAAEYALILAIIGTALAAGLLALGGAIGSSIAKDANCMSNSASCS